MAKEREKKSARFSVATAKTLIERLAKCAEETRLPQSILAEGAIQAAVEEIERHGYRVAFPMEFNLTHVPVRVDQDTRILRAPRRSTGAEDGRRNPRKGDKPNGPAKAKT